MRKNSAMGELQAERVLIWTHLTPEGEASSISLSRAGFSTHVCADVDEVRREIQKDVGALLVSREALCGSNAHALSEVLSCQPKWSHLSVIVLLRENETGYENARGGGIRGLAEPDLANLEVFSNLILLECPARIGTLVTTVRTALAYRRRQYQMRDLLKELEKSRQEAMEAHRVKSDFLANMSHEIRTPLGVVIGFSELLMESAPTERERQVYMSTIRRNGQILSALIDDILDLANVESGRIDLEKTEFSVGELIAGIVNEVEPKASRKRLSLVVERDATTPDVVRTDPVRLKQILSNLLTNAVKFTSQGALTLRVRMEAGEDPAPSKLRFEIEDTGIGILPKHVGRLFQPFSQVDTSSTRRFGGTGLGLVLSRRLARALGGDLRLQWSLPGAGSCFEFFVPVEVGSHCKIVTPTAESDALSTALGSTLPLRGIRILVVDDSLDNQLLIARILRVLGAQVELANDGREGVDMALRQRYDAILMDLQMPRLGGVEATRILREKGFDAPIVAVTAHTLQEDRMRCLSVGCNEYLTKPIQRQNLVAVLERVARSDANVRAP
ncbi:MAG: ATP-binding protein [Bdellovibrionales bacterium]